jgi:DNA-directed RNA polymerase specialized sigma24 family protein
VTEDQLTDFYPWLRKTAGNLVGFDDPAVDDLVQEGYIAMWEGFKSYDPAKGPLIPRLQYLARKRMISVAYGHHQWTGHEPVRGGQEPPEVSHYDGMEDSGIIMPRAPAVDAGLPDEDVAEAVADLPDLQRQYVYLRFWIGGGIFGKSAGMNRLREEFPLLSNDKLWSKARETLRQDPRMQRLAHLR